MKVRELIEKLEECDPETEVFDSGLPKSYMERTMQVVRRVEKLNKYVVIVSG